MQSLFLFSKVRFQVCGGMIVRCRRPFSALDLLKRSGVVSWWCQGVSCPALAAGEVSYSTSCTTVRIAPPSLICDTGSVAM